MSFLPPGENIIETKKCRISGKDFFVTDKDLEFYDKISPIFAGKKYSIPSPTLCSTQRMIRRFGFRNERSLFYRKCDLTGKQIIAQFPTNSPYTVYDKSVWYGDDWTAYTYGRSFDFSRPFFDQFHDLKFDVPRMALIRQGTMENSDFCNRASDCKNCYLLYSSNHNEDSYYGSFVNDCFQCIDNTNVNQSEMCYECIDCHDCHRLFWSEECKNCRDAYFLKSCVGCSHCLFCTNLTQKQYCIRNKQLTKEEYETQLSRTDFSRAALLENLKHIFSDEKKTMAVRSYSGVKNEHVSGNHIDSSRNSWEVFDVKEIEDCRYCQNIYFSKNCMDHSFWGQNSEWIYEVQATGRSCSNVLFCNESWDSNTNIMYCDQCMFSKNLFGCCGVKRGENSVLNIAYSQHEYETLCGKVIDHMQSTGEWGEFFPLRLSPFGYNETMAHDYFPLTEGRAKKLGYNWKPDDEISSYHGEYYTPLSIHQYDERKVGYDTAEKNIQACLEGIIECQHTKKPFKIIKPELAFYIENSLPIPVLSPNERYNIRAALRTPRILYERTCMECGKEIQTVYDSHRTERVLCEVCFQSQVFS